MKKSSKVTAVILSAVLAMSMIGCGSSAEDTASDAAATDAVTDEATDAAASDEATDAADEATDAADETADETAAGDRTQLIVGFDAEYPPYGYMDENGEYVGFDLDLAQEVCARNGWELVKQPIDWDAKDMELNSGSIDCIWNGFTMTGREDDYTFSEPYVDNSIVVVVAADSDIQSLEDLAGKVVATQADSSALTALTDDSEDNKDNIALAATFAELQQVADYNSAFMNLEAGSIDAIAVDIGVAQYQISSRGDMFRQLDTPISTEQYAIGFKKGNTELLDAINASIANLKESGKLDEIVAKYITAE
mgnify:FL=1